MKKYIMIVSMILLSSCGMVLEKDVVSKEGGRQFNSSNNAFSSYLGSFETLAQSQTSDQSFKIGDIPVNFGDTENPDFQGVCFTYSNGDREIIIKKEWWDNVSQEYRESLLFHELGHCRLGRKHQDSIIEIASNFFKSSMMNSSIVGAYNYKKYKSAYIEELFTQETSALILAATP